MAFNWVKSSVGGRRGQYVVNVVSSSWETTWEFLSLSSPLPSFGVVTAPSAALPLQFDVGSWDHAGSTSQTDLLHFLDVLPERNYASPF